MVDPFDASYVQEPNNMVSDPPSHSEDSDSTSSWNRGEGNCEEHCRPRKKKKRRRKISHIIKYVIGFSFMKKLKINKKSQKQRSDNNDDDKPPPPTTTIHHPNSHHSSHPYLDDSKPSAAAAAANESPYHYQSLKASPLMQCNSSSSSPFPSYNSTTPTPENDSDNVEPNEELEIATSSTKRLFGFVGMHHVMLIISLAALVLSGKACAIFCTIVWLVLIPLTSRFSNGSRRRWTHLGSDNERALIVRKFMARF